MRYTVFVALLVSFPNERTACLLQWCPGCPAGCMIAIRLDSKLHSPAFTQPSPRTVLIQITFHLRTIEIVKNLNHWVNGLLHLVSVYKCVLTSKLSTDTCNEQQTHSNAEHSDLDPVNTGERLTYIRAMINFLKVKCRRIIEWSTNNSIF